jgi:hypothetical protein
MSLHQSLYDSGLLNNVSSDNDRKESFEEKCIKMINKYNNNKTVKDK